MEPLLVEVNLVLDGAGMLRACRVEGHAGAGTNGNDIVCAAVSVLTRTMIRVLNGKKGIMIRGDVSKKGSYRIETEYTPEGRDFLAGAGAFLVEGLTSVSGEYPDNCKVIIERRN